MSALTNIAAAGVTDLGAAYAYCEKLVSDVDKDRYLATLFAPPDKRGHVNALYAFSFEVARIREVVSDPLPGEVRLQWWRDVLQGQARGDAMSNPVAAALVTTIEAFRLPIEPFVSLIDARIFDLYDDPMPTVADLEGYCAETCSALVRLATIVLAGGEDPGGADAAGHAGLAHAICGLLRAFPWHAMRGQVYVPKEYLLKYGATRDDVISGRGGPGVTAALGEMRALARLHLEHTRALRDTISPAIAPAFLPTAVVEGYLAQMERPDYDPYTTIVQTPQWRRQWTFWRQARRAMR